MTTEDDELRNDKQSAILIHDVEQKGCKKCTLAQLIRSCAVVAETDEDVGDQGVKH